MAGSKERDLGRKTAMAEERTEDAAQRTIWAQRRTALANERTFNAWLRLGLSTVGGGLAVVQLLSSEGDWLARAAGLTLVALGVGIAGIAGWRYHRMAQQFDPEKVDVLPPWIAIVLLAALMLAVILVLLLVLQPQP